MDVLYTTVASFSGGGTGQATTEDGILKLEIRAPKEMGGPGGEYTNPEQLFAIGYASCFGSAINYAAMMKRKSIDSLVTATVHTGKKPEKGFQFKVDLDIRISGLEQKDAEELVEEAKQICPYSGAVKDNIEVKVKVITA